MSQAGKKEKSFAFYMTVAIILIILLYIITFLLFYAIEPVSINLNGGRPVIDEREYLFEPGMTVEKTFYIENEGSWDVYYKIYFSNVLGELSDVLEIQILHEGRLLYEGTAKSLTKYAVKADDSILESGERRVFTIRFHFPESAGNAAKNATMAFDLCADAVQNRRNPKKVFEIEEGIFK